MRRKVWFSGLIVFIAVVAATLYGCGGGGGSAMPYTDSPLVNAINMHRTCSLPALDPLEIDPALQTAAQEYATHVASYAPSYSRNCSCGCGSTLTGRLLDAGVTYTTPPDPEECGIESSTATDSNQAAAEILSNPTFRSYIENPDFTHIGVGSASYYCSG